MKTKHTSTKKKTDLNSETNQKIKGQFVAREVKACFSYEMDSILGMSDFVSSNGGKSNLPTWEDVENLYSDICPKCGEEVANFGIPDEGANFRECPYCKETFRGEDVESEPSEVFEWWIVTEFLYRKLKEKGQPVLEWGNNYYWGRCTTGQAILLDGVISSICSEMEILDGQKFSWADKKGA